MDDYIINGINDLVGERDTLWHLGDFSMGDPRSHMDKIRCRDVRIILGNHDRFTPKVALDIGFSYASRLTTLKYCGEAFILCHYAMRVWNRSHHGSFHLYGHSHGALPNMGRSMDVGVDTNRYLPYNLDDLVKHLRDIPYVIPKPNGPPHPEKNPA